MSESHKVGLEASGDRQEGLPWRRGVAWLLFLGPFFFLSYGFANWWTATHAIPATVAFEWERHIPFLPWTIVPYWSIDLLYGLSFLLCIDRRSVDTHALRLLTAQIICIGGFLAFPLRFSFARPGAEGVFGALFDALAGFDQPFNQAPSLHIALLVILWVRYASASSGLWLVLTHLWACLIGLSVLTTYQHHFIDVPFGALVGLLCLWLWPDGPAALFSRWQFTASSIRRRIAGAYLALALLFLAGACFGGLALWLFWPAVVLAMVSLIYLGLGPAGFQKQPDGRLSTAAAWLLAPYIVGARINSRLWTWRQPAFVHVADGVCLGRLPSTADMIAGGFAGLLDLTAEMPASRGSWIYRSLPWLDLLPPTAADLILAADAIEAQRRSGPLLVCCALGYSRSAAAVAAWLLRTQRVASAGEAIRLITKSRPQVVLGAEHCAILEALPVLEGAING